MSTGTPMATRRVRRAPRWLMPAILGFLCGVAAAVFLPHHLDRRSRALAMLERPPAADADAPRPDDVPAVSPSTDAERTAAVTSPARSASSALEDRALMVPVENVDSRTLIRSFDDPRGSGRRHEAIDIPAPRGTPVRAVESGTIARLFTSAAGGLTVYQFDPAEEWVYYYAHLDGYATGLAEGDEVQPGQVLGYVGTTGNAPDTVPHLHFAIMKLASQKRWWEGTPVDPYPLLRRSPP